MKGMEELLDRFAICHVLVVGDLMLDEYRRGHVERISAEAPVPILNLVARDRTLGGAGNVVKNLRSLGVRVSVVGVIGQDSTGDEILELLESLEVHRDGVIRDLDRISTRKVRYVSVEHGQQVFRADEESHVAVHGAVEEQVVTCIRRMAPTAQVILCSDYLKGTLTPAIIRAACGEARSLGLPSIVAPKAADARKYEGADILVPNLKELSRLVGTPVDGNRWLAQSARHLTANLHLEALLVTRGSEGLSLFEVTALQSNGDRLARMDVSAVARNVFDVTGAGDTAIAAFAAGIAAGADRKTAAQLANVAAGIAVGKRGTAAVSRTELLEQLIERWGSGMLCTSRTNQASA